MKKILCIICLSLLSGCQSLSSQTSNSLSIKQASAASQGCPRQPEDVLKSANVKAISLSEQPLYESEVAKKGNSQGFIFEAQAGQKLNYQTESDICVWVYSPDNQLLSSQDLPTDGKYTIQVSVPQGSKTFEIAISLDAEQSSNVSDFNQSDRQNEQSMIGTWLGSFGINSPQSKLVIDSQSGQNFKGNLTTIGKKGGTFVLAVEGEFSQETRELFIQEVAILSEPGTERWFLGKNIGKISSNFQDMVGVGEDSHGNQYSWMLSKQ
jgi:hypothetical protein